MPVRKFRSFSEAVQQKGLAPGTEEFSCALRAVFWLAAKFAPRQVSPPGVHKFRSIEEAQARRKSWQYPRATP